jgi:hypothetical protein
MMSEGSEKLRDALWREPVRTLCLPCVGAITGLNIYEARKAVRELILLGQALASLQICSSCHRQDLVVNLRISR